MEKFFNFLENIMQFWKYIKDFRQNKFLKWALDGQ